MTSHAGGDEDRKDAEFSEMREMPVGSLRGNEVDDAALSRLGKKSVLKRRFAFLSVLGFSCTVLITWESSLVLFVSGLQNGGTAGVIYGYILVWMGTISTFIILSELVSIAPTSGGQYHWVSMLAPPHLKKSLSYVSGWLTVAGWQAGVGSGAYLTGSLIQGLLVLTNPNYVPEAWHATMLYWAVLLFSVFINIAAGWLLPKFEGLLLVLHILGFFSILIPLLVLGPKNDLKGVFTNFSNTSGWESQGLSFCIGIMGSVFSFVGGDGPIHMSEEIQNAAVVVPRSIMTGLAINGTLGFVMVLAVLMRAGDIEVALEENPLFPFMVIFKNAVGSTSGAAAMSAVVFTLALSATVGLLASASRVFWAFSRDQGLPGWLLWSRVTDRTSIPTWSVCATASIAALIALVNIGSPTAFNGIVSVSIAGLFASYLLVSSLLLYRRCTGGIVPPSHFFGTAEPTAQEGGRIFWGPWRIPGVLGIANNVFCCMYLLFVFFFSFWPSSKFVAGDDTRKMNWSLLVAFIVACFSGAYYYFQAKKTYHGPIVEVEPRYVPNGVA